MQETPEHLSHRDAGVDGRRAVLSDEVVAFIESGVSIVVGVVGPGGRAQTGRALAARVMGDGTLRLIYSEEGNSAVTATAQTGGPIAVTFSAPLSNRTLQIKGSWSRRVAHDPADDTSTRAQTEAFGAVLRAVGHTQAFVKAFINLGSAPLSVLVFPAQDAFEQTPGPGAGRSL